MRLRVIALPVAVALMATAVLVLAASGCGGSDTVSKEEYAASVVKARDRVDYALTQITVGTGSVDELISRLESAADRIDEAASDLDGGGVADGFESKNAKLADAFHQLAADLAGTASDASQPGNEAILTGVAALEFPSWIEANRILADLNDQGIAVKPIGSH